MAGRPGGHLTMAEPRHLPHIIDRILQEIPRNAVARPAVERKLGLIKERAEYVAPECCGPFWATLSYVLNEDLGWPPDRPWKVIVNEIVEGRRS
jgi:hypothetical protein